MLEISEVEFAIKNVVHANYGHAVIVRIRLFACSVLNQFEERAQVDNWILASRQVGTALVKVVETDPPTEKILPPNGKGFGHGTLCGRPQAQVGEEPDINRCFSLFHTFTGGGDFVLRLVPACDDGLLLGQRRKWNMFEFEKSSSLKRLRLTADDLSMQRYSTIVA